MTNTLKLRRSIIREKRQMRRERSNRRCEYKHNVWPSAPECTFTLVFSITFFGFLFHWLFTFWCLLVWSFFSTCLWHLEAWCLQGASTCRSLWCVFDVGDLVTCNDGHVTRPLSGVFRVPGVSWRSGSTTLDGNRVSLVSSWLRASFHWPAVTSDIYIYILLLCRSVLFPRLAGIEILYVTDRRYLLGVMY